MDSTARTWCEERKMLHWVNSLPPPACLLVEALADLRFGDVLLAIVRWLRAQRQLVEPTRPSPTAVDINGNGIGNEFSSCDASVLRLRRVLLVVAREARSEDGDALFVVNEAYCAERIRGGALDAICAVLRILKRLGDQLTVQIDKQRLEQEQQRGGDADRAPSEQQRDYALITTELLRLNAVRDEREMERCASGKVKRKRDLRIVGLSSNRFHNVCAKAPIAVESSQMRAHQPAKLQPSTATKSKALAAVGLRTQTARKPKTTKSRPVSVPAADEEPQIPMYRDSKGQLHVYSMIDPTPHKRSASAHKSALVDHTTSAAALRVHAWMDSLGVVLQRKDQLLASKQPVENPRTSFRDGVVLCQIAAGIVKKCGDEAQKRRLETFVDQSFDKVVLLPPEAILSPQNAAQRRRNVAIAVDILTKFCGMQRVGVGDNNDGGDSVVAKLIAFFTANRLKSEHEHANGSVYELLDHVRVGIEASRARFAVTEASAQLNTTEKSLVGTLGLANGEKSQKVGVDENSRPGVNVSPECVCPTNPQVYHSAKRRPYITSEQMHAVNRWLKSIDKHMVEVRKLVMSV